MEELLIQHVMDEEPRNMTLDEAFLEALNLSDSRSNEVEEQEYALLVYLQNYPDFIAHITEDYKKLVLEGWEFKILNVTK